MKNVIDLSKIRWIAGERTVYPVASPTGILVNDTQRWQFIYLGWDMVTFVDTLRRGDRVTLNGEPVHVTGQKEALSNITEAARKAGLRW